MRSPTPQVRLGASIPPELEARITARMRAAIEEDVVERIWAKDASLWGGSGTSDGFGWLTAGERMRESAAEFEAFADEVRDEGTKDVVLLGIGGCALAPEVIRSSLGSGRDRPRLHVLDSPDPGAIRAVEAAIDPDATLVVVSSKSGETIETMALYRHFWWRRPEGEAFVAITDAGSPLEDRARAQGFRRTFAGDPSVGRPYGALSPFGLVPAALIGADIDGLLDRSAEAEQGCRAPAANPGLWLGVALAELAIDGHNKLTEVVDPPLHALGLWLEQLVADSTGKQRRGIVPVLGEPPGDPLAYGVDRAFLNLRESDRPNPFADRLAEVGQPVIARSLDGPTDLGHIFFVAAFAMAVAAWALGVDPFDHPDVEESEQRTVQVLEEPSRTLETVGDPELRALLEDLVPPRYLALLAWVAPSPEFEAAAAELRGLVRDATGAATTFDYGPRYLHSTAQLHKGGPTTGRFLHLVGESLPDIDVPNRPYTFGRLMHAEAIADLETLRGRGLPAELVALGNDPVVAMGVLTERIRRLLRERPPGR